ncbi:MAG: hypothetical protein FWE78_01210 [Methanimicrococcus sp.]|nr:hypothetical protein [Methanimicrococcus sp.]
MSSKIAKILIFSALALLLLSSVAAAQEWVVTATGDTDKVNNSLTSLDNMTLRQAISMAGSGDTIVFANNISEVNVIYGTLNISKDLTIGGNNRVLIKRSSASTTQDLTVFTITGGNVVLRQLTIENGNIMNGTGGAVLADGANVTFDSCIIQRNRADFGGAIYVANESRVNLTSTLIYKNNATNDGSAIYIKNGTVTLLNSVIEDNNDKCNVIFVEKGQLTMDQSRFMSNNATTKGSPVNASAGTTIEIRNSTFSNNGGFENAGVLARGTLIVQNSVFDGGKTNGSGGAISLRDGGNGIIDYSLFTNNTAAEDGGAIFVDAGSSATVKGCTFLNNLAKYGGAFFGRGTFTIDSCTAVNNTATFYGGAIAVWNDAKATLTKNAIAGNTAKANNTARDPAGGGLNVSRADAVLTNNVIVGNIDPREIDFGEENSSVRSNGNNLVGVYRGTGRFPIGPSDATGITMNEVFVIGGSGLPAVTKATGYTAGYDRVQLYTVELNSSPNNPAASILGNQPPVTPAPPTPQPPTENNTPQPEAPADGSDSAVSSILVIIMFIVVAVVLLAVVVVGAFAYLRYRRKKEYKFG